MKQLAPAHFPVWIPNASLPIRQGPPLSPPVVMLLSSRTMLLDVMPLTVFVPKYR